MENKEFYNECAKLLKTEYTCNSWPWPGIRKTRWNNRSPGEGRFPNFGLIRCYGSVVHVNLYNPVYLNRIFNNREEALNEMRKLLDR